MLTLLLLSCAVPATAWPDGGCRVDRGFAPVTVELRCGDVEASWAMGSVATVVSDVGEYAVLDADERGVAWSPAGVRVGGEGWLASSDGITRDGEACDGEVRVAGLPEGWTADGTWVVTVEGGVATATEAEGSWSAPWPRECPLAPSAWTSSRVVASCGGVSMAVLQLLAPAVWGAGLDGLGQPETVAALWAEPAGATCDGAAATSGTSLAAGEGVVQIDTDFLSVERSPTGEWSVVETACGACDAWDVTVEGLPEL